MFFGYSNPVRLTDVTDGLSNSFFVGERGWKMPDVISGWCEHPHAGLWVGKRWSLFPGGGDNISLGQWMSSAANPQMRINHCNVASWGFSSDHDGGAYFMLGDGSVRFVSENIDSLQYTVGPSPNFTVGPINGLYERLLHRSDGGVVGDF